MRVLVLVTVMAATACGHSVPTAPDAGPPAPDSGSPEVLDAGSCPTIPPPLTDAGVYPWDAGGPFVDDGLCTPEALCHVGLDGGGTALWAQWLVADYLDWQPSAPDNCDDTIIYAPTYAGNAVFEGVKLPSPQGASAPLWGFMVARLNAADGSVQWARFFGGGDVELHSRSVAVRADRHIVVTGFYVGSGDVGFTKTLPAVPDGEPLPFVILLTPNGEVEATDFAEGHAYGWYSFAVAHGNDTLVAGGFEGDWVDVAGQRVELIDDGGSRHEDAVIVRYDSELNPTLLVDRGLQYDQWDPLYSVDAFGVTPDGSMYLGYDYVPQLITKFAMDGHEDWTIPKDNTDPAPWNIMPTADNNIIVTRFHPPGSVFVVESISADGGLLWQHNAPGNLRVTPDSTALGTDGSIYIACASNADNTSDFGQGPLSSIPADAGSGGDFLLSYDRQGTPRWGRAFVGNVVGTWPDSTQGSLRFQNLYISGGERVGGSGTVYGTVDDGLGFATASTGFYPTGFVGFYAR